VEALVNAMCFMIENPQEVERFAVAGRKVAEEKFDVRKVNKTIMQTMGLQ
jgi:glycosyltransferase involved in cell wall biosynthesis